MTPTISVIVPVYNVEHYLAQCIDSILAQTFADFELILIDDGSPDDCGRICDEYAEKDTRIRVIHQENGGVSKARNRAIDIAQGEYVCFVDSDDLILPMYLERLFTAITENNADIASCGHYITHYQNGQVINQEAKKLSLDGDFPLCSNALMELQEKHLYCSSCFHLLRINIIRENNISFLPIPRAEDASFMYRYLSFASTIAICPEPLYNYIVYLTERKSATGGYTPNYYDCYSAEYQASKQLCEHYAKYNLEAAKKLNRLFRQHFWDLMCDDFTSQLYRGSLTYKERLSYIKDCISKNNPSSKDISYSGTVDRLFLKLVKKKACHRLVWLGYMRSCLRK